MIYSNVYKNVEKEIRKTEYEYKCCLIESMATEETFTRTQERMEKIVKKLEREIEGLEAKVRS